MCRYIQYACIGEIVCVHERRWQLTSGLALRTKDESASGPFTDFVFPLLYVSPQHWRTTCTGNCSVLHKPKSAFFFSLFIFFFFYSPYVTRNWDFSTQHLSRYFVFTSQWHSSKPYHVVRYAVENSFFFRYLRKKKGKLNTSKHSEWKYNKTKWRS